MAEPLRPKPQAEIPPCKVCDAPVVIEMRAGNLRDGDTHAPLVETRVCTQADSHLPAREGDVT